MRTLSLFIALFFICSTAFSNGNPYMRHPLDNMPIMEPLPEGLYGANSPVEQRGEEFRKFLSKSLKIKTPSGSGSGTIIYYDEEKNLAYVASCGHLWNSGVLNQEDAKKRKIKCKVVTWYKNDKKLDTPEEFDADLLFYSYTSEVDTSLLVFSPNWKPSYFPIAPLSYKYRINSLAHSCGCDGGREVAHYEVKLIRLDGDLITINNSPRPGRSGGGLFDENFYIGTCWGTQYVDGSGIGYFTPLKDIHGFWGRQRDYAFLLERSLESKVRSIPIVNKNKEQENFSQEYILLP